MPGAEAVGLGTSVGHLPRTRNRSRNRSGAGRFQFAHQFEPGAREFFAHQRRGNVTAVAGEPARLPGWAVPIQNHYPAILRQLFAELSEKLSRVPDTVIGIGKNNRVEGQLVRRGRELPSGGSQHLRLDAGVAWVGFRWCWWPIPRSRHRKWSPPRPSFFCKAGRRTRLWSRPKKASFACLPLGSASALDYGVGFEG